MSIVPIIIAIEAQYKDYLSVCEKLQINPSKQYEQNFIDQKIDERLNYGDIEKKEQKKLNWFQKHYKKMEGGFFGNKFISRAKKEMDKGKLILSYEVQE